MYFKNLKRIIFIFALFLFAPILAKAAEMGARSATINSTYGTNVLLGGNYIELGINNFGAFMTDNIAGKAGVENFHTFGAAGGQRLGLAYNEHIWGVGEPKTTDFTTEQSDIYYLSYKIGTNSYVYGAMSSTIYLSSTNFDSIVVSDKTDNSTTELKAKVVATTPHNVALTMDISFGVNDKFFVTNVKVENKGTSEITDVRFTKINRPAMDSGGNSHTDTYQKILSNPTSSKPGSDTNFAMISTRGPVTKDGWFYFSNSNQAKVNIMDALDDEDFEEYDDERGGIGFIERIWNKSTAGVPTYADADRMSIFYNSDTDENGWVLYDEACTAITFKLGNLATSEEANEVLYTSLDNNIIDGLNDVLETIQSESIKKRTDTRIEVNVVTGYEYSIDNWATKNTTGIFTGLTAGTEYTIKSRKESDGSDEKEVVIRTKNAGQEAVKLSLVAVSDTAFSVKGKNGYQYSIDNGAHWTDDETFKGLTPNTEYKVIGRLQETYEEMYGKNSEELVVKTLPHKDSALDDVDNVEIDINIVDIVPTLYFNSGALYEAVMNDTDVKTAVEANKNVRIMFDIVAITTDNEDKEHFEGKTFGFAFDVEIKLYVDNVFVKNISESENVEIKVAIPKDLQKSRRKFYIVRKHDTVDPATWALLNDTDSDDETVTFLNNEFSEFFVVYEDEKPTNPKTGDAILMYVGMLTISASSFYLLKKREN